VEFLIKVKYNVGCIIVGIKEKESSMGSKFNDCGQQIVDAVDKALSSKNFEELSGTIDKAIKDGINTARTTYGRTFEQAKADLQREKAKRSANTYSFDMRSEKSDIRRNKYDFTNYRPNEASGVKAPVAVQKGLPPALYSKPRQGVSGKLMIAGGIAGGAVFGLAVVGGILAGAAVAAISVPLALFAGSLALLGFGFGKNDYASRFMRYAREIRKKNYIEIEELARRVGRSASNVRRDLDRMIEDNSFKQGHIDDSGTTFIATDDLYEQYRKTQANVDAMEAEKAEKIRKGIIITDEVQQVLDTGDEYIRKIHKANEEMPEPVITEKLDRLESIIGRIFERVKNQPREAGKLSQFMDYYLPTTMKLVEAYRELRDEGDDIETAVKTRNEILESLDAINSAYEVLLDSMFKEKALDVKTDISVMKTMMKQDGLASSDFEIK
jgi:5-bromo-4-chloroindolyl phosphate hydrolysis protein